MKGSKHRIAMGALLLVTAGWGLTFPLIKDAIETVKPFSFISIRFAFAWGALMLGSWVFEVLAPKKPRLGLAEWGAGSLLGLFLFGTYSLQTIGMQYTSSSNAGFLTGLSVVLVPLVLRLMGVKVGFYSLLGIFLSAIGVALLSIRDQFSFNKGDFLVIGCAIMVSLHIVFVGRFSRKFDPVRLTQIQIFVCLILSCMCAGLIEGSEFHVSVISPKAWGAMAFCGLVATAVAYLVQNSAQAYVSPVKTALILTLEPVFGALFSMILLKETLGWGQWAGGALMVAAMIVAEVGPMLSPRKKAQADLDSP
jgi:drug/metabolite transporter (DMT)-like permease